MSISSPKKFSFRSALWDLFCISSFIGIWPRYIEPRLISTTAIKLPVSGLTSDLKGLKIIQISDLHLNPGIHDSFLDKVIKKVEALQPDIIVMTGDFLCYGQLAEPKRLAAFLNRFHAPYGCFAVLGNHDYESCVSINTNGEYDVVEPAASSLSRAFSRLFDNIELKKVATERVKHVAHHKELLDLLSKTPFELLDNITRTISVGKSKLNLTGLGEFILGRCNQENAFKNFDTKYPGITLLHNPDGMQMLTNSPGDIVLSGHTHGGQVNLPFLWKKFTLLENMEFKKGLKRVGNKWLYINRGIGSILPFRWFSMPEILFLTLEQHP